MAGLLHCLVSIYPLKDMHYSCDSRNSDPAESPILPEETLLIVSTSRIGDSPGSEFQLSHIYDPFTSYKSPFSNDPLIN